MEEGKIVDEVSSTQKSLLSCHDPGWNDPPQWAFSPTSNTIATPTKRLLNKRVAFPLSSGSPGTCLTTDQPSPGLSGNLPPPVQASHLTSAPHAPFSKPSEKIKTTDCNLPFDRTGSFDETVKNLEAVINEKFEASGKMEEVRRRLEVMKSLWEEDKLADGACEKVFQISEALRRNDVESADKIHVSLMMEHAAICNTWISGIRHMILELREKSSSANSVASSQDSNPYLLPQSVNKSEEN